MTQCSCNQGKAHEQLERYMSEALHALAQPLSAAQAALELGIFLHRNDPFVMQEALDAIQRAVACYESCRTLRSIGRAAHDVASVDVRELAADLSRTRIGRLEAQQVALRFEADGPVARYQCSPSRVEKMLASMLEVGELLALAGEQILVHLNSLADAVHITLELVRDGEGIMRDACHLEKDAVSRALVVARCIVLCTGGELYVTTRPVRISAQLPLRTDELNVDSSLRTVATSC